LENIPSTSKSVEGVYGNGFSLESNLSQSNTCPFVSDVRSLAWGLCGDMYKQHREPPFREFLFVVGDHGVMVHAFRQLDESNEVGRQPVFGDDNGGGRWVEWGPSYTAVTPDSIGHQLSTLTPKKWLRSFLCSAKTLESEGSVWTCFPDESKLPCSATVFSFNVSFNDSLLLSLCCNGNSVLYECAPEEKPVCEAVDDERNVADQIPLGGLKSEGNVSMSKFYSCFRVFSSCFHDLAGFVLSSESSVVENGEDPCCRSQGITVVVASLDLCGLRWLYSVRLPQMDVSFQAEWMDFQISDKFLISLNNFGFILIHGAMTGEYIRYLDALQIYEVKPEHSLLEQESLPLDVNTGTKDDVVRNKEDAWILTCQTHGIVRKQRFQRLIMAPYSSLFSVVDECGVVYVICANDHMPDYYLYDKILPQYSRLGMLAPWKVGYSDISHRKLFVNPSSCEKSVNSFPRSEKSFMVGDLGGSDFEHVLSCHIQGIVNGVDLSLNGFPAMSQQSAEKPADFRCLRCIRKIFLPTARFGLADTICFSSFGITRLNRRNITKNERSSIVHTDLYIESDFCEDRGFNAVNRTFGLQSDDGEAIGCIFQGCLYLVTKKALSVVLPAVSVSSDSLSNHFLRPQSIKTSPGTADNFWNSLLSDERKQLGSPWQVAVIDRVLLCEGPDEADCLCLENGEFPI